MLSALIEPLPTGQRHKVPGSAHGSDSAQHKTSSKGGGGVQDLGGRKDQGRAGLWLSTWLEGFEGSRCLLVSDGGLCGRKTGLWLALCYCLISSPPPLSLPTGASEFAESIVKAWSMEKRPHTC